MSLNQIKSEALYSDRSQPETNRVGKNGLSPSGNDFLKMMVACVQNQNPLNPTDGTQYLSQLGMMSAVQSLEGLKAGMNNVNIGMTNSETLQATNLVGKKVVMELNHPLHISENQSVDGRVEFKTPVDNATVRVYDAKGKEVKTIKLGSQPAGMVNIPLSGEDLGAGDYRFEVISEKGGAARTDKMMIAAKVESVNIPSDGGSIRLSLSGGTQMYMYDMREITA